MRQFTVDYDPNIRPLSMSEFDQKLEPVYQDLENEMRKKLNSDGIDAMVKKGGPYKSSTMVNPEYQEGKFNEYTTPEDFGPRKLKALKYTREGALDHRIMQAEDNLENAKLNKKRMLKYTNGNK
jgi:hypothetical protein